MATWVPTWGSVIRESTAPWPRIRLRHRVVAHDLEDQVPPGTVTNPVVECLLIVFTEWFAAFFHLDQDPASEPGFEKNQANKFLR